MCFRSQKAMFRWIREERKRECVITGAYIYEARAWCFSHLVGKGSHPELKLLENNVVLVKGIEEHYEVDRLTSGNQNTIVEMIKEGQEANDIIDFLKNLDSCKKST